ncbi:MAG: hypothetical protein H6582_12430 [Crocinitomicaceae bacterium]|nr:hypothetical protein [Crocinitomicaceae bacterium]
MQVSSLNQFGGFDFAFFDLKHKSEELDDSMIKMLEEIEIRVIKCIKSRKNLESEVTRILPELFSFRMEALEWLSTSDISISDVPDEIYPEIESFADNPKLKTIGFHISNALAYNRKLIEYFTESGAINQDSISNIAEQNLDFQTFLMVLKFLPNQIRKIVEGLFLSSLQIEFLAIAAFMINNEEITCTSNKFLQINEMAKNVSQGYIVFANGLIAMAKSEQFFEEKTEWKNIGLQGLSNAYGDDEPDYDDLTFFEPNPDYQS